MALPVEAPVEIKNGRIATEWIDAAVANTRANAMKLERLADEIRSIRTHTWTLHPGNILQKLRVFAAWFIGQSRERREEVAAEYTRDAIALQNRIAELVNSASTAATELKGLKSQINKVVGMFEDTRPALAKAYNDASKRLADAVQPDKKQP